MKRVTIGLVLGATAVPVLAQGSDTAEQRIAYYKCMMMAAVRASYTEAADHEIDGIARAVCATARVNATMDRARQPVNLAAIDAADAPRATNLASWAGELRDRRRASGALYGLSSH